MKRGEIWTADAGSWYVGKPRPVVIIQGDAFEALASVTVCALTTDPAETPLIRPVVEPSARNGLRNTSRLMIDKIATVPRSKLRQRLGRLSDEDVAKLTGALLVFVGLAGASPPPAPVDAHQVTPPNGAW